MHKITSDYRYKSNTVSNAALNQVVHWFESSEKSLYKHTKQWMDLLYKAQLHTPQTIPQAFAPHQNVYVVYSPEKISYNPLVVILGEQLMDSTNTVYFRIDKIGLLPQQYTPQIRFLGAEPTQDEIDREQKASYKKHGRKFLNNVKKYIQNLEQNNLKNMFDVAHPVNMRSLLPKEWTGVSEGQVAYFLQRSSVPLDDRWWNIVNTFDDAFRHRFMSSVVSEIQSMPKDTLTHMVHAWCMLAHACMDYYKINPTPWRVLKNIDDKFSTTAILMQPQKGTLEKPFFFLSDAIQEKESVFQYIRTLLDEWPNQKNEITYAELMENTEYTNFVDYVHKSLTGAYGFTSKPKHHIADFSEFQSSQSISDMPKHLQAWISKDKQWKADCVQELRMYEALQDQKLSPYQEYRPVFYAVKKRYMDRHMPTNANQELSIDGIDGL